MLDLHVHVLPGIDDGPRSNEEAFALLQGLIADGVTHAVATPHIYNGVFDNSWASISAAFNQFADELDKRQLPITLSFAAEVRLCADMIGWLQAGDLPVMAGVAGEHAVLVELPDGVVPIGAEALLSQVLSLGVTPIIAHPERNRAIMEQPGKALALARLGCKLQLTAGSLLGEFGDRAQLTAVRLLGEGAVHLVASDAHNMRSRLPRLGAAQAWLRQHYGDDLAVALTVTNPTAMAGRGAQAVHGNNGLVLRELPLRFTPVRAAAPGAEALTLRDLPAKAASPLSESAVPDAGAGFEAEMQAAPAATATNSNSGAFGFGEWLLPALKTWDPVDAAAASPAGQPQSVSGAAIGAPWRRAQPESEPNFESEPIAISEIAYAETQPMAMENLPHDRWTETPMQGGAASTAPAPLQQSAAAMRADGVTAWMPDGMATGSQPAPLAEDVPVLDKVVRLRPTAVVVPFVPAAVMQAQSQAAPVADAVGSKTDSNPDSKAIHETGLSLAQFDPVKDRRAW